MSKVRFETFQKLEKLYAVRTEQSHTAFTEKLRSLTKRIITLVTLLGQRAVLAIEGDECKQCVILRQWLEAEQEKREYYEKLLLTRVGVITAETTDITDISSFPSVRKVTMSTIRRWQEKHL